MLHLSSWDCCPLSCIRKRLEASGTNARESELAGVLVHFNIAIHGHLLHEARSFRESQMVFS